MPESLPVINCANCTAACCSDIFIGLYIEEADRLAAAQTTIKYAPFYDQEGNFGFLQADPSRQFDWSEHADELERAATSLINLLDRKTSLKIANQARTLLPGQGVFWIIGSCGFLGEDNRCLSYDNRPGTCVDFETAGPDCLDIRRQRKVPVPVTDQPSPDY